MRNIIIWCLLLSNLWGYASAAQDLDKVVAVVNESVITASELNAQVAIIKQQMQAKNVQLPPDKALQKQVLQNLIDVELQLQLAKNNQITVDATDLEEAIANIAERNHLTVTALREAVGNQGVAWAEYRENVRKEMLMSRIQQKAINNEINISPEQIEAALKDALQNKKSQYTYHVQHMVVPLPESPTTEQVKTAESKALGLMKRLQHGEDFNVLSLSVESGDLGERHLTELPQLFAERVVQMKVGEVAGPIRAGNGFQIIKLISIGGQEATKHQVVKTHARHILLKQNTNMTEIEAKQQIDNLYQQLRSGKDFAAMAKQYSLDPGSASKGGDLGWVTAEQLVPAFAKAMEDLPLKKISQPVKTPYGWHIIEVLERKSIDDSEAFTRQQVKQFLQQRKFAEAVQSWQQHLRTEAYIKIFDKELA